MVPRLADQVTFEYAPPFSLDPNCVVSERTTLAAPPVMASLPSTRLMIMLAVWVGLLVLVAVSVTVAVCGVVGAVYRPLAEMLPMAGARLHITALLMYQPTALNCMVVFTGTLEAVVLPAESESARCGADESGAREKPLKSTPRLLSLPGVVLEMVNER